jgi:hypothetical protein
MRFSPTGFLILAATVLLLYSNGFQHQDDTEHRGSGGRWRLGIAGNWTVGADIEL